MRTSRAIAVGILLALAIIAVSGLAYLRATGLSARARPGASEARVARVLRGFAVPARAREQRNPVASSPEVIEEGMAHFADHCAVCHGNDGSGDTQMGRGLYPNTPDMRLADTQNLTDGELFTVIEQGVRFTGMPGWSTGTAEGTEASWYLVHFVRHLPRLTPAEREKMKALNPRSPDEIRQEIEEQQFLQGDGPPAAPASPSPHHHGGHR